MSNKNYIGRFAPSPTGPLHFGSLVTAIASYFQAKSNNGKWLVRIEDIDKERQQQGASSLILKTLEAHQLLWDDQITYQSERQDYYDTAITKLNKLKKLYRCQCSRKTVKQNIAKYGYTDDTAYPGTCRNKTIPQRQAHSLRLQVDNHTINFTDTIQGKLSENLQQQGDFVIQRMDGSVTYQLAVAIDDVLQNITEVVRGVDLIDSSPRQIFIMKLLDYPIPRYGHIPVICNQDGSKLSKQTGAAAVDDSKAAYQIWNALCYLGQRPPAELQKATIQELHIWASHHWNLKNIPIKHNYLFYM